jgi:hypothetical protein
MIRYLAAALLGLLLASAAAAQTMPFACPDPGTKITFDNGVVVVSRGADGMDCRMDMVDGKPFRIRGLLLANPSADGADVTAFVSALRPERLWPLEVGRKIEATYNVGGKAWNYILSVTGYDKRPGPGDALIDCFIVEMNEQGPDGFHSQSRWWISPRDKYMIRFDATNSVGKANRAIATKIEH